MYTKTAEMSQGTYWVDRFKATRSQSFGMAIKGVSSMVSANEIRSNTGKPEVERWKNGRDAL